MEDDNDWGYYEWDDSDNSYKLDLFEDAAMLIDCIADETLVQTPYARDSKTWLLLSEVVDFAYRISKLSYSDITDEQLGAQARDLVKKKAHHDPEQNWRYHKEQRVTTESGEELIVREGQTFRYLR